MIKDFVWQYINIDQEIIVEIQKKYLEADPNNIFFFQDINLGLSSFLGLEVQKFVLIQVEPFAKGRIHTDWRPLNCGSLALNIPLYNCEHSVTEMWESECKPWEHHTSNGQPYSLFDRSKCKKISEFKLTNPVLFRTDIPHSVNNYSDKIRKAISIRFKEDPWHLV
jgi:hypothetical protein